ncbi:hypothetical protein IBB80_00030 [Listeria marthii]|uniref:Uncharacterized protein n=1 Tax=Listeria swaminathanii TaxID=2713501 RepID=A0ABU2IDX5_9LIST|nr:MULTISPECIES: hypothetical protein [Listeria]MBC2040728.1 hypothetical protein [Listeria marthii]MBC2061314.1 hypothetical protein [Listeria marthii]MBC2127398.1 hypothetical protein [Listeria marthii]MBF2477020.1 hypothetical protein [Listeria marthii]MBF2489118.1 hypothetical protein [Listeria marthii]
MNYDQRIEKLQKFFSQIGKSQNEIIDLHDTFSSAIDMCNGWTDSKGEASSDELRKRIVYISSFYRNTYLDLYYEIQKRISYIKQLKADGIARYCYLAYATTKIEYDEARITIVNLDIDESVRNELIKKLNLYYGAYDRSFAGY